MKTFKKHISEGRKSASLRDIVKALQSSDFGMTEKGGNGDARVVRGNLVVKDTCFFGCSAKLRAMVGHWTNPKEFMAKYAADEWNVRFKHVKSSVDEGGKIYGKKKPRGEGAVLTMELKVEEI